MHCPRDILFDVSASLACVKCVMDSGPRSRRPNGRAGCKYRQWLLEAWDSVHLQPGRVSVDVNACILHLCALPAYTRY